MRRTLQVAAMAAVVASGATAVANHAIEADGGVVAAPAGPAAADPASGDALGAVPPRAIRPDPSDEDPEVVVDVGADDRRRNGRGGGGHGDRH